MKISDVMEEALLGADQAEGPIDIQQVEIALREAIEGLQADDQRGAWPDLAAFAFTAGEDSPWGSTYFGPSGSTRDEGGNVFFFPDLREVSPDVVDHWARRAKSLRHPVLRARYADLVWDLGRRVGTKPEVEFARLAIDAYNQAVGEKRLPDLYSEIAAGRRALSLAISIGDAERIDTSRDQMLLLFSRSVEEDIGWSDIFQRSNPTQGGCDFRT